MDAQQEHFRIICEFNDAQDDKKRLPPSYKAVEYARGEIADLKAQVEALEAGNAELEEKVKRMRIRHSNEILEHAKTRKDLRLAQATIALTAGEVD